MSEASFGASGPDSVAPGAGPTSSNSVHRLMILQILSDAYENFLEEAMDPQNVDPRKTPASEDEIARLSTCKLSADSEVLGDICTVCREDYNAGDKYTIMACGHGFHHDCLSMWLGRHNTCPHCRYPLLTSDLDQNKLVMQFRNQLQSRAGTPNTDRKLTFPHSHAHAHLPLYRPTNFASNRRLSSLQQHRNRNRNRNRNNNRTTHRNTHRNRRRAATMSMNIIHHRSTTNNNNNLNLQRTRSMSMGMRSGHIGMAYPGMMPLGNRILRMQDHLRPVGVHSRRYTLR